MFKQLFFLVVCVITLQTNVKAQLNTVLEVYQFNTDIGDCDGFLAGDSDPAWRWTGPDITNQCYTTTCNGCTVAATLELFNANYTCINDVPSTVAVTFKGCEDDGSGCAGGTFTGICDGTSASRTDNLAIPTAVGTYLIGPFCANSTGCAGNWCYWARWTVTGAFTSAPANDNICSAIPVPFGSTIDGNNTCATVQGSEIVSIDPNVSPSNSVWYSFVPTYHSATITTNYAYTQFDTEIAVYEGSGVCPGTIWNNLLEVDANDDIIPVTNLKSKVDLTCLTPGQTYYIQVDGNSTTDFGQFRLGVINNDQGYGEITPDEICSAYNLGTLSIGGTLAFDNLSNQCATSAPGEPSACFSPDQSIWATFTTGSNLGTQSTITVQSDPNNYGDMLYPQFAVYTSSNGNCNGALTLIDCDNSGFLTTISETMCLSPYTTYYIQMDGTFINSAGFLGVSVTDDGIDTDEPDMICDAVSLGTLNVGDTLTNFNLSNICASTEPGEPVWCNSNSNTIWTSFETGSNPGSETTISIVSDPNNYGNSIDPQFTVYESSNGLCTGSMTGVDCTGNILALDSVSSTFCVKPNTVYFVQIDGTSFSTGGYLGVYVMDNNIGTSQPDNICDALNMGTLVYGDTLLNTQLSNMCATSEFGQTSSCTSYGLNTIWTSFTVGDSLSNVVQLIAESDPNNYGNSIYPHIGLFSSSNGSCTGSLTELVCASSYTTDSAVIAIDCLTPNTTYFVKLDGTNFLDPTGYLGLTIQDVGVDIFTPDSICNAYDFGVLSVGDTASNMYFSNFCATTESFETNVALSCFMNWTTTSTNWMHFTTGDSIGVELTITSFNDPNNFGNPVGVQMALYSGTGNCTDPLNYIDCSSGDPFFGLNGTLTVSCLEPNTDYYIQINGPEVNENGYYGIEVFFDTLLSAYNNMMCDAYGLGSVPNGGAIDNGIVYTNFCADIEAIEPTPANYTKIASTWFTFEAPASGNVSIYTISDPESYGQVPDLQFSVYQSSDHTCTGVMNLVDEVSTISYNDSLSLQCLVPDRTYFIQMSVGLLSSTGYYGIVIEDDGPGSYVYNNDICNAHDFSTIGAIQQLTNETNICANTEPGEPLSANAASRTVWYEFTAPFSGSAYIEISNFTGIFPKISLFSSSNDSCTGVLNWEESALPLFPFLETTCLIPGKTYFIQVDGSYPGPEQGTFDISIQDLNPSMMPQQVAACDSFVWSQTGSTYYSSGIYYDTLLYTSGCDSLIALDLSILNTYGAELASACDSYTWLTNGNTYSASGIYTATLTNSAGCDSTITLDLTITNSTSGSETVTACDNYTWAANGNSYNTSGSYTTVLTNASGCDSTVTLDLTITNSNSGSETITACDNYTWTANGNTYNTSGTYTAILINAEGCDSTATLDLTITNSNSESETVTACDNYTWTANGNTYNASGIYTAILLNSAGCDSTATLDLTITNSNVGSETVTSCDSYTWTTNGNTYNASGTYTAVLTNTAGCDSTVTLDLTITNSNSGSETVTACNNYTWPADGNTYNSTGSYTTTLTNVAGCDSIVTLNLTINSVTDNSTTLSGITIMANNSNAAYVWLDCDNNFSVIPGETNQSFTPSFNGNYAVELSENSCVDTSACVAITSVGIIENTIQSDFVLYPNPTDGFFSIQFSALQEKIDMKILDVSGKMVSQKSFVNAVEITYELDEPNGVYLVELSGSNDQKALIRLIKL